jgi:hypothetical protein
MAMIEPLATQSVVDDEDWDETGKTSDQFSPLKLSHHPFRFEVELSYFPHVVQVLLVCLLVTF